MNNPNVLWEDLPDRYSSKKPRRFLVFAESYFPEFHLEFKIVTDNEYEYAQDFVEAWFSDPTVIRIYELRQCYAIGKVKGQ